MASILSGLFKKGTETANSSSRIGEMPKKKLAINLLIIDAQPIDWPTLFDGHEVEVIDPDNKSDGKIAVPINAVQGMKNKKKA